jgi:hypothetical protein
MRYLLLALALLLSPLTLDAQKQKGRADVPKGAHSDFSISVNDYPTDTLELDLETVYVSDDGAKITVTEGDAFAVTDGDGTDGTAAVTIVAGQYDVYARATGKAGRTATLNGQTFTVTKKKKTFEKATADLSAGTWDFSGDADLSLRFYQAAAPADTTAPAQ